MNSLLPVHLAARYKSPSQIARVLTEAWAFSNLNCPACGSQLELCPPNTKYKDFNCSNCGETYQLKSSGKAFANKVLGAAYSAQMESIASGKQPSVILLQYNKLAKTVSNVQVLHRACITASCIIPRTPLGSHARRAGWQGYVIELDQIPITGRITLVKEGKHLPPREIQKQWQRIQSMLMIRPAARGWTTDVLKIVERLGSTFDIDDVYGFENELMQKHPDNRHIQAKIRQQLQILRDMNLIKFGDKGQYTQTQVRDSKLV